MPVTNLRYLKRYNYKSEQDLQRGYLREIVQSYGIDVVYFRRKLDFYHQVSGTMANYTYGESTTSPLWLSGNMVVYFEVEQDAFLLNRFGIEHDGDVNVYFTTDDFYEEFRDSLASPTGTFFQTSLFSSISGYSGIISGACYNDLLSGVTSAYYTGLSGDFQPSGQIVSGNFLEPVANQYKAVNHLIARPRYFKYEDRIVSGMMSGIYAGFVNASGVGSISGQASGDIYYYDDLTQDTPAPWKIAPQVGDFFRITFRDDNQEEYEVSQVYDRNIATDGINPLLANAYLWKCQCVRRDPSHEVVSVSPVQEEPWTTDKSEEESWIERDAKNIFDLSKQDADQLDTKHSDDVYGTY